MKHPRLLAHLPAVIALALASAGCSHGPTPRGTEKASLSHWPDLTASMEVAAQDKWADANKAAERALDRSIQMPTGQVTFESVIDALRASNDLNIIVNWYAIGLVGVKPETMLALQMHRPAPGRAILDVALMHVSADAFSDDRLDYRIKYGCVFIATKRDLLADKAWHLYDTRWYVGPPEQTPKEDDVCGPGPNDGTENLIDFADTIQEAVIEEFANIWDPVPQTVLHNGFLLIRATPEQHTVIRKLLIALKAGLEQDN